MRAVYIIAGLIALPFAVVITAGLLGFFWLKDVEEFGHDIYNFIFR